MKKLAISLVIVLGVLLAADFGLAAVAEYQVAQKMRSELRLDQNPEVRIKGFPFLAQAVVGDFRDVELEAPSVQMGQLNEVGVEATLSHARISPTDVLTGNADRVTADEVDGRVRLRASDLGRFIRVKNLTIAPAPEDALEEGDSDSGDSGSSSGDGQPGNGLDTGVDRTKTAIQLDGSVNIAGENTKVRVIAVLSLLNGKLNIDPRDLEITTGSLGEIPLPELFENSVLQQFTTTLDPGTLPFEVVPTAVRVEPGSLIVEGTAKNVSIGRNGLSTG